MATIARYFAAGRHLRLAQAVHWLFRRNFGRRYRVPLVPDVRLRKNVAMSEQAPMRPTGLSENAFDFLNRRVHFPGLIDWHLTSQNRLWIYNLHYFDYALDSSRDPRWTMRTMLHWISEVPPRKCAGWEPYPVSLRIVNWIKFALAHTDHGTPEQSWQISLYQQTAWLERNLEHEIQANHLLKNAKALFFGGAYFAGPTADRWLRKGLRLMLREVQEQFLPDGGHYERSAMYHAIALEDLLDVISLMRSTQRLASNSSEVLLRGIAQAALSYLNDITYPDGSTPMFNDSVEGIAKGATTLSQYGRSMGLATAAPPSDALRVIRKATTGYYGYRLHNEMLMVDAGPIGPSHQPGHGHCDMLSFELVVRGRPIIVNSGVFDYEDTALRTMLRQTAAHNTVRLDHLEQSDIWGSFRVGRRALTGLVDLWTTQHQGSKSGRFQFGGWHQGYRHLPGRPMHHRNIDCEIGHSWKVKDEVRGSGQHRLESFIHFHPDFRLQQSGADWILSNGRGEARFRLSVTGGRGETLQTVFCPSFGKKQHNTTMRVSVTAALPHVFGYLLEAL